MSKVVMGLVLLTYLLISTMAHAHCGEPHKQTMSEMKMDFYVRAIKTVVLKKDEEQKKSSKDFDKMISKYKSPSSSLGDWEKMDDEAKALQLYNGPMTNQHPSSFK